MSRVPLFGIFLFILIPLSAQQLLLTQKLGIDPSIHKGQNAYLGAEVCLKQDMLFLGAPGMTPGLSTTMNGAVLYYQFDSLSEEWKLRQTIYNPLPNQSFSRFGTSISVDDSTLVISAPGSLFLNGKLESGVGAVFIFQLGSNGIWQFNTYLIADKRTQYLGFGEDVALSGDFLAIATPLDDYNSSGLDSISNAGAVYVYQRNTLGQWVLRDKICDTQRDAEGRFGYRVDIEGSWLLIGAPYESYDENDQNRINQAGAAYLFYKETDDHFYFQQKLLNETRFSGTYFGQSVSIGSQGVLVGSLYNSDNTPAAVLYTYNSTLGYWQKTQEFNPQKVTGNQFGISVSAIRFSDNNRNISKFH